MARFSDETHTIQLPIGHDHGQEELNTGCLAMSLVKRQPYSDESQAMP